MDKRFTIKTPAILLLLLLGLFTPESGVNAQIFEPDGLRMPGNWNGFTNTNGMGGPFDFVLETTGTRRWVGTFQATATGSQQFKFASGGGDPWVNQWADRTFTVNSLLTGLPFCASCNPANNTITTTNGRWYHVNWRDNGYGTTSAIFMETSNEPVTISSVSNSLGGFAAAVGANVTITVNTSAVPSPEEKIYVRYTTNSFATSTLVEATFGALPVGTAVIPGQADGATVEYYVFSTTITSPTADFDMLTIRFNNNGGSNYNYSVSHPTATVNGNWNTSSVWNVGFVPNSATEIVRINANVTMDISPTVQSISLNGGTLSMGANTLSIADGGNFNKGAGALNAGTGTVAFLGNATVTGGAVTFYNATSAAGLVNFGGAAGVSNEFRILSGGGTVTNRPLYSVGSSLVYASGGNYFSSVEWEGTFGGGDARPYNVTVTAGTDLVLDNLFTFECRNDLTIADGSSLNVDASAQNVGVFGDFINNGDVTLSSASGDDLFVRGNWSNSGTFDSNDRAVFFDAGGTQTISGNTTIDFVVVDKSGGSVTLQSGATLNIAQGMTTTTNLTVASGGTLRFESTPTRTAWLNNYSGSGNVVGDIIMERYVPGSGIGYHFIGAPVSGATIGGELSELSPSGSGQIVPLPTCDIAQIDGSSPYGNVFRWIESAAGTLVPGCEQDGWHVVSGATAMTPGEGFAAFINGGSTIDVSGSALNGTVTLPGLSNSGGSGDGWQMVSNPFPSPVTWTAPSGFEVGAHFFQTTGTYSGTFQVEASGTGYVIESMQAFQVRVPSGSATFSLGNANRTTDAGSFFRTASWYEQLLVLDVEGNGYRDKTTVYFVEGATDAYEPLANDASKRMSRSVQPTLYTLVDGQMTGINALAPLAAGPRSVPMALKPGQDGNFTFSVKTLEGFPASALVLLEDLQTGTVTNLMETGSYSFSMSTADAAERFVLHFVPAAELALNAAACDGTGGSAVVNIPAATWDTYELLNSELTTLASGLASEASISFSDLSAGDYSLVLRRGAYESAEALRIAQPAASVAGFEVIEAEGYYAGEPIQWMDRSEGAAEYRWDFGDGTILSGVAEPVHSYASPGEYRIVQEVWSADGCADLLEQNLTVQARLSGIAENNGLGTLVWNQGLQVYVEGEGLLAGTPLRLLDLTGRTVAAQTCNSNPCSIEAPAAGAYLLMLGEGVQPAQKLILHD